MNPISAVSFVRNEGHNIADCLSLIKPYVDEIIIIDLESTDNTVEEAKKFTDQVFVRPFLLCGDMYKMELAGRAKNQWLLWFYPDERWITSTMEMMESLIRSEKWTAYSFMRREYMDGVRIQFYQNDRLISPGTAGCTNYQNRLHRLGKGIFYTECVHAELHGQYSTCGMPPEYYFEHHKTSKEQELDNIRLYIWYKYLVWKYGDTTIEPYKTFVDSYKKIIFDSEALNNKGERRVHPAEEEWWDWRKHVLVNEEGHFVDRALKVMEEKKEKEE